MHKIEAQENLQNMKNLQQDNKRNQEFYKKDQIAKINYSSLDIVQNRSKHRKVTRETVYKNGVKKRSICAVLKTNKTGSWCWKKMPEDSELKELQKLKIIPEKNIGFLYRNGSHIANY